MCGPCFSGSGRSHHHHHRHRRHRGGDGSCGPGMCGCCCLFIVVVVFFIALGWISLNTAVGRPPGQLVNNNNEYTTKEIATATPTMTSSDLSLSTQYNGAVAHSPTAFPQSTFDNNAWFVGQLSQMQNSGGTSEVTYLSLNDAGVPGHPQQQLLQQQQLHHQIPLVWLNPWDRNKAKNIHLFVSPQFPFFAVAAAIQPSTGYRWNGRATTGGLYQVSDRRYPLTNANAIGGVTSIRVWVYAVQFYVFQSCQVVPRMTWVYASPGSFQRLGATENSATQQEQHPIRIPVATPTPENFETTSWPSNETESATTFGGLSHWWNGPSSVFISVYPTNCFYAQ